MINFEQVRHIPTQAAARAAVAESADLLAVVDRGYPRAVLFQCPCGCGEMVVINVDPAAGRAWRLRNDPLGVTLMPSVWRTTGCQSHFILWRNQVWWCDWYDEDDDEPAWPRTVDEELREEWRRIRREERERRQLQSRERSHSPADG
jgi:uncharacterized protein DUF6527